VEVVAIQYPEASGFYFAVLRWISSWKLVVTFQGSDAHELHRRPTSDRFLVKRLLSSSDCITAVSKSLYAKVMELFPSLQRKRCSFLPNGAPLDLIDQDHPLGEIADLPASYVFSAGLLIHRKGFDLLIKAVRLARDCGVEINLVIAGDGPEREALARLTDEVDVSENITFVGAQAHEGVLELMKRSQHFVLASRAEGMPLVIAEAMACGKAVVATNVDGVSEIVQDGRTGVLVKSDDAGAMAQALIKLHTDPVLCGTLASNGKQWARKEFSWEAIADRYLKLFGEL
jgi:glycosyltransferase involved in cell wall biosynthesis